MMSGREERAWPIFTNAGPSLQSESKRSGGPEVLLPERAVLIRHLANSEPIVIRRLRMATGRVSQ